MSKKDSSNGQATPQAFGAAGEQADASGKRLTLQKIYVKDLSFEAPNSPQVFTAAAALAEPQVQLNLKSNFRQLSSENWEVVLTLTIDAKNNQDASSLFLVELHQAGIFTLVGYSEEERKPLLGGYCLHTLYPYAREAVSDLVSRGGFPPLLLQPINFDAVYRQQQQAAQQKQAAAGGPATPVNSNGSTH